MLRLLICMFVSILGKFIPTLIIKINILRTVNCEQNLLICYQYENMKIDNMTVSGSTMVGWCLYLYPDALYRLFAKIFVPFV